MKVFELMDKLADFPAGAVVEVVSLIRPKDLYQDGIADDSGATDEDSVAYEISLGVDSCIDEHTDEGKRVYIYADPPKKEVANI